MKQYNKPRKSCALFVLGFPETGDDPLAAIRLPQRSLSSQSLGKWNNQKTEHIATKKGAIINNNTIKHAKV